MLLAQHIAEKLDMDIDYALQRVKYNPSQSKLSISERLTNTRGIFKYTKDKAPRNILIIDDIATTFSTINSAAQELKKHRAKIVGAVVIARGG